MKYRRPLLAVIAVDSVWFNDTVEFTVGKVREIYVEFTTELVGVGAVRTRGKLGLEGDFEDWSGVVILKWHSRVGFPNDM